MSDNRQEADERKQRFPRKQQDKASLLTEFTGEENLGRERKPMG